jgi:hypothetical protein
MSNCLRPVGIPCAAYRTSSDPDSPMIPHCDRDAMPAKPGSWISTSKGVRRLLNDEIAKGLGVPKAWLGEIYPSSKAVANTISLHLLEGLTSSFVVDEPTVTAEPPTGLPPPAQEPQKLSSFQWTPPDLTKDQAWYRECVADLMQASLVYESPGLLIEEGLQMIGRHRNNYDKEGPKPNKLQLLWWRFPRESWDELRTGCSMNFLVPPRAEITPNSAMDEEQICIAEEFIDELVSLSVLTAVKEGEMVANGPLFCLPKPRQPGQWRVLSDMRRGGQNEATGSDPTVFPKSSTIVDQLYAGGCLAVVDASKFFYQFPTKPEERKYLGCIHLRHAHLHYVNGGLPMGSGNSPAIAGRHGAAFCRLVRSTIPEFQGTI